MFQVRLSGVELTVTKLSSPIWSSSSWTLWHSSNQSSILLLGNSTRVPLTRMAAANSWFPFKKRACHPDHKSRALSLYSYKKWNGNSSFRIHLPCNRGPEEMALVSICVSVFTLSNKSQEQPSCCLQNPKSPWRRRGRWNSRLSARRFLVWASRGYTLWIRSADTFPGSLSFEANGGYPTLHQVFETCDSRTRGQYSNGSRSRLSQ